MSASLHPRHYPITVRLLAETVLIYLLLAFLANWLTRERIGDWIYLAYPLVLLGQGLWLDRIYVVGHEATHRKLLPAQPALNDAIGTLVLLPILVPINIYRKIHAFHHGFNRKDHHTSALDVFVSPKPLTPLRRAYYKALWFIGVFAGGYFLHSLASIIIFLFLPTSTAVRISPAFKGWNGRDRLVAWAAFGGGIGVQFLIGYIWGAQAWAYTFGYPLLVFAWIWSMLVYVFHYDTSIGDEVRYNVRSLSRHWFFSWLLMNFNEHSTHHMSPNVPWYLLPQERRELPERFRANQNVRTIWAAIAQQFRGPIIVEAHDPEKSAS